MRYGWMLVMVGAAALVCSASAAAAMRGSATSGGIEVVMNGEPQQYSVSPMMTNGSVVVPMREFLESLGARVEWDRSRRIVTATRGDKSVTVKAGASRGVMTGGGIMHRNTVMVPVRFVSEALGAQARWDGARRMVIVEGGQADMARGQTMTRHEADPRAKGKAAAQPEALATKTASESEGRKVYRSQGCTACHRINGQGGTIGPDLSHVGASRSKAWLQKKITHPKASAPDSTMPAYTLSKGQLDALVGYLAGLR
jgi:mono/diheme cytochrome c family protein